jgi:hypothetical protein
VQGELGGLQAEASRRRRDAGRLLSVLGLGGGGDAKGRDGGEEPGRGPDQVRRERRRRGDPRSSA